VIDDVHFIQVESDLRCFRTQQFRELINLIGSESSTERKGYVELSIDDFSDLPHEVGLVVVSTAIKPESGLVQTLEVHVGCQNGVLGNESLKGARHPRIFGISRVFVGLGVSFIFED
jgi:hypothetical protein